MHPQLSQEVAVNARTVLVEVNRSRSPRFADESGAIELASGEEWCGSGGLCIAIAELHGGLGFGFVEFEGRAPSTPSAWVVQSPLGRREPNLTGSRRARSLSRGSPSSTL